MDVLTITYNFGSTTQNNMNRKTIRFILAFSAEHRRYNNTLYNIFYYIQICGVRTRTELSDSLHRILSEQRPEKTCRKKTSVRKKTRQEIWVGSMAHALKSPSYEGYTAGRTSPLFTKQVFQSPLLPCRRNISFPANSYPLKRWKFHAFRVSTKS